MADVPSSENVCHVPAPAPAKQPWQNAVEGNGETMIKRNPPIGKGDLCVPCHNKAHDPCCVTTMVLRCGHGQRGYLIKAPGPATRAGKRVLQVVADAETSSAGDWVKLKDTINVTLSGGPCVLGRPGATGLGKTVKPNYHVDDIWPAVCVSGPGTSIRTASPFKFDATSSLTGVNRWETLFRLFMDRQSLVNTYTVSGAGCAGTQDLTVTVEAFPLIRVTGKVSQSFTIPSDTVKGMKKETTGTLNGGLELKAGTSTFTLGAPRTTWANHVYRRDYDLPFRRLDTFMSKVAPFFAYMKDGESASNLSATLEYPNISLEVGFDVVEKADWRVATQGFVKLNFNPLLGVTFKVDVLFVLLGMIEKGLAAGGCPPIWVAILRKARDRARTPGKFARGDIAIDLEVKFHATAEFEWRNVGDEGWKAVKGKGALKSPVTLKGTMSAEVRCFIVSFAASATGGAKSEIGFDFTAIAVGAKPGLQGGAYFAGVKLYYAYLVDVGTGNSGALPDPKEAKPTPSGPAVRNDQGMRPSSSNGDEWLIWAPARFPEQGKTIDLSKAEF
ncbi:hypothetical protein [Sphingomonas bacterium]|uniref:hypothetical protein n=1 Tax=Sphingomonas bacterium TaxID=1895847 RepID=UPI002626C176|nr:hypothetical protein [Sphingomonas bacterium]